MPISRAVELLLAALCCLLLLAACGRQSILPGLSLPKGSAIRSETLAYSYDPAQPQSRRGILSGQNLAFDYDGGWDALRLHVRELLVKQGFEEVELPGYQPAEPQAAADEGWDMSGLAPLQQGAKDDSSAQAEPRTMAATTLLMNSKDKHTIVILSDLSGYAALGGPSDLPQFSLSIELHK